MYNLTDITIRFKMDNKKHIINLESFRDMLHIRPRLPGQSFVEPPFEEEIIAFLCFLGHSGAIRKLTEVNINKLHQPWRSFAAIINKCLTKKSSGYDSLRLSQAQIIWGLYHKRNVDFAYLMWEYFVYQVEHKDTKKSNEMYYPRFTKIIIHHFMSKDPSIPRRNKVNWQYVRDDYMITTIKLVSRHQNAQQFSALLPIKLTNEVIKNSNAYKEYYAVATGATPLKPKASVQKTRSSSDTTITPPTTAAGPRLSTFTKGKHPATTSKAKSISALSEVAMTEAQQLKLATKRSMQQTHISQASGFGADERTGDDYEGKDGDGDDEGNDGDDGEEGDDDDEQDDDEAQDDDDEGNDEDDEEEGSDDEQAFDEEEFIHPNLSTHAKEETKDEESFDPIPKTPKHTDDEGNGEENIGINVGREEGHDEEEKEDELYIDVNINQGKELIHVITIYDKYAQFETLVAHLPMYAPTLTPSTIATITTTQQAPTPPTTAPSTLLQDLPNFGLLFGFDNRLKTLEANFSEFMQTNQFAGASDCLRDEDQKENDEFLKIIDENMQKIIKEQVKNKLRNLYKALVEAYESDKIILDTYGDTVTLKRRRDDDAGKDEEPFDGSDRGSKRRREGKELESASAPKEKATRSAGNLVELEFFLEEVYKATTDQLDWVNLEGQQYPHNLLKPLPLIPDSRGRRVIPFDYFINNDLEYLRGGASSRKYTTSVTKIKASDYGHIKWIEDLLPRTMWIQKPVGKLTNLTVEERFAFNVSLRMFTRSIVIQRRMEGLQLSVESYQKKLNLTSPDTYRSDLKRKEAYSIYSNPRGFIYQNKDKKNRLMRIDELHKFSDGSLTDVRTALDDRLKGIRIKYLPKSIWRKSNKDRAAAMIQAIDKLLKTRRIMRSLERFVGGRLYEGDFRILQRTI
uniref:Monodehydroascorbate reductase n=2 Tax=Tanacetum cinerariifolium TaxID=118510 RepID=A0A699IFX6_TANCI|nr:hypothetical protein [Tanacetum cinerariifolium]